MKELQVPTRRILVVVHAADGARMHGSMYHSERLYQTGSPGDIGAELNDERHFLPFAPDEAAVGGALLNKRHIVRVFIKDLGSEDLRPEEVLEAESIPRCEMLLSDKTRLKGQLVTEAPSIASRLVDRFNQASHFVPFVTDEGVQFVNTSQIVRIEYEDAEG